MNWCRPAGACMCQKIAKCLSVCQPAVKSKTNSNGWSRNHIWNIVACIIIYHDEVGYIFPISLICNDDLPPGFQHHRGELFRKWMETDDFTHNSL